MDVPNGYKSTDVIDRRKTDKQSLGDKVRDLSIKVRDDYNDSFDKNNGYKTLSKPLPQKSTTGKRTTGKR